MKSVVTEYTDTCIFCGRPAEGEHHLIFGTAGRELSEKDGLKIPVCNNCHNMGQVNMRIHDNPMAEKLSKMLGQAIWEKELILTRVAEASSGIATELRDLELSEPDIRKYEKKKMRMINEKARDLFRRRYGKSYL